ncbi:hypothetical protein [Microbacterium sp. 16-032]|uniref:hypothetical protein n=1 Tax=Microbacterium sp. 16-032 TaxID=3239808 RepID=UPI0034E1C54D
MSIPRFQIDDDVMPTDGARGKVVDIRDVAKSRRIYGVADVNGAVSFYMEDSLRAAPASR